MGDFGTFGRYAEPPLDAMSDDQRAMYDKVIALRGEIPGPQKIIIANVPLAEALEGLGAYWQDGSASLSKAEVEIVTVLANAHWGAAYSSYVHEKAAIDKAGLPADTVAALISDLPASFEDDRQQVVYEVAHTLLARRVLPVGLFRRAIAALGDRGLTDLTVLLGYFTAISLTLNAYDVPSNATGVPRNAAGGEG